MSNGEGQEGSRSLHSHAASLRSGPGDSDVDQPKSLVAQAKVSDAESSERANGALMSALTPILSFIEIDDEIWFANLSSDKKSLFHDLTEYKRTLLQCFDAVLRELVGGFLQHGTTGEVTVERIESGFLITVHIDQAVDMGAITGRIESNREEVMSILVDENGTPDTDRLVKHNDNSRKAHRGMGMGSAIIALYLDNMGFSHDLESSGQSYSYRITNPNLRFREDMGTQIH